LDASAAPSSPSFAKLVALGVEHILTGWDHLLFLFGLLLLSPRLRSLGLTISAFTVAHSITLGLAAFGVWTPPSSIIEPAIALSIAWVGVENVRALVAKRADGVAKSRWRITFPFGLVHGFGFASALRELGMSRADVPKALLGFNLGVELGQLAVVIPLALALAWIIRSGKLPSRAISFASAAIVAIGLALFVARVA
ncbi:MAG TPA: HupE/UreJ family protein, partial [Polyangiaceae bacterium]